MIPHFKSSIYSVDFCELENILKFKCLIFSQGAPFLIDAKKDCNGTWIRNGKEINFLNFTKFDPSECQDKSVLSWNPGEANCDWPCGKLKCLSENSKIFGLCVAGKFCEMQFDKKYVIQSSLRRSYKTCAL